MSDAEKAFEELKDRANKLNLKHWAETGNNADMFSMMLTVLWIELKKLTPETNTPPQEAKE